MNIKKNLAFGVIALASAAAIYAIVKFKPSIHVTGSTSCTVGFKK